MARTKTPPASNGTPKKEDPSDRPNADGMRAVADLVVAHTT